MRADPYEVAVAGQGHMRIGNSGRLAKVSVFLAAFVLGWATLTATMMSVFTFDFGLGNARGWTPVLQPAVAMSLWLGRNWDRRNVWRVGLISGALPPLVTLGGLLFVVHNMGY